MSNEDQSDLPVAEPAAGDVAVTVNGQPIGEVDGLLWEDTSGVDIISVTTADGQVAVPVDHNEWRGVDAVELHFDEIKIVDSPLLGDLVGLTPDDFVDRLAEHYSMNLGGPPPGPDVLPLPPWWPKDEEEAE